MPYPPTVNTYWRRNGNRYFISKKGKEFKDEVYIRFHQLKGYFKPTDKLEMLVEVYPPNKRKMDIDNLAKAICDSLGGKGAGIYDDDSQIDKLTLWRCRPLDGCVVITIGAIE